MLLDGNYTLMHHEEALHCMFVNPVRWLPVRINAARMANATIAIEALQMVGRDMTAGHVGARVAVVVNGNRLKTHPRRMQWWTSCCKGRGMGHFIDKRLTTGSSLKIYLVRSESMMEAAEALVDVVLAGMHPCAVWFPRSIASCRSACPTRTWESGQLVDAWNLLMRITILLGRLSTWLVKIDSLLGWDGARIVNEKTNILQPMTSHGVNTI